jgi:ribosomal-protein-alanine N-acetyltransferase
VPKGVTLPAFRGTAIDKAVLVDGSSFELRGSLITVRDFLLEDEDAFVEWAGHQEMYEYMVWRLDSAEAAAAYFHGLFHHSDRTASRRRHWYLAVVNSQDVFCGITGFDVRQDGRGEFGWYLAPRFWGRGYATEISSLFLEFGFENLGLPAILATCDPDNLASRHVLEKSGLSLVDEETVDTWQGERQRLRFMVTADERLRSQQ